MGSIARAVENVTHVSLTSVPLWGVLNFKTLPHYPPAVCQVGYADIVGRDSFVSLGQG